MKVQLGCGRNYRDGWVNVDMCPDVKADIHCDLEVYPWPFKDGVVEHIEMNAVIEHLHDTLKVLAELHRILSPGGIVHISTGYYKSSCAFQDPTHVAFFHEKTMDFVRDGYDYNFYVPFRFKILEVKLVSESQFWFQKARNLIPFRRFLNNFMWNMYDRIEYTMQKL